MYAVVKTGGKQYRVTTNDVIIVEKIVAEPGSDVELDQVLALGGDGETEIGTPLVEGARVSATVVNQTRGKKVLVYRKLRRKDFHRLRGHRQDQTVLKITDILPKSRNATTTAEKELESQTGAPKGEAQTTDQSTAAPAKKAAKKTAKKVAKKLAKKVAKKAAKKVAKKAAKKVAKKAAKKAPPK
ncbi:MAG: 50S ribosomal protein L21 [Pseudomonadota bacterium]|nr:50S ribosomal protein L21 [Pseudomonadota bacterium]